MTRLQFRGCALLALLMALAFAQLAGTQEPRNEAPLAASPRPLESAISDSADRSYKIYSLDDFGSDPGFCEWIAQTIPDVIAAGTWKGPGAIRYYPPKNILVVCHTSAVQAQVDGFLKDVKKSLPQTTKARAAAPKSPTSSSEVIPTLYLDPQFQVVPQPSSVSVVSSPAPLASKPAPEPSLSYPVPAQAKPPKHLFHFIIRYEGEGIIDDSVVKAMKDYYRAMPKLNQPATPTMSPPPPPANPAPGVALPGSGSYDAPSTVPPSAVPAPNVTVLPPGTPPATPTPAGNETETKKGDKGSTKERKTSQP